MATLWSYDPEPEDRPEVLVAFLAVLSLLAACCFTLWWMLR